MDRDYTMSRTMQAKFDHDEQIRAEELEAEAENEYIGSVKRLSECANAAWDEVTKARLADEARVARESAAHVNQMFKNLNKALGIK